KDGEVIGMGARAGESRLVFQHPDSLTRDAQLNYPIYQSLTSDDLEAFLMKHASVPNEGPVSVLFGPWDGEHVRKQEVAEAIQAFARLLANTPELESFFTPQAISDAKTAGKEAELFEKADKTIRDLEGDRNSDQFREFAFGDLELIKAIEPP